MPTPSDLMKAARAAVDKAGGKCEPQQVVDYRLSICQECPKRRPARGLKERASVWLSGQSKDSHVCDVCGCSILLLTTARPATLHEDSPEERSQRPKECWLHDYPI